GVGDPSHNHGDYGHGHGIGDPGHHHYMFGPPTSNMGGNYIGNVGGGGSNIYYNEWTQVSGTGIWAGTGYVNLAPSGTGIWIGGTGANWGHNNVQPTMALNKLIKR